MYPIEAHVFGSRRGLMQVQVEKPRALIVDDECTIADTLALIFQTRGFQATACYSGERAVELAKTRQFDFLISDVCMEGLNGVEAAIVIRQLQPECRVLLMSGQPVVAEILHSAKQKGHTFEIMAKPVHPESIFEALRNPPQPFLDA